MKAFSPNALAAGFLLLFFLVAPHLFYPVLLMKVLCFILLASAFNLLLGYAGLLSFGHAAFFGLGAYVAGVALKTWHFPVLMGLLAGTLVATVLGWIFGALAIRRQGIYFAMVTLALAQMVYFYLVQASFTGGEDGLQGVPRGVLFGLNLQNDLTLYYLVLAICVAGFALVVRTIHSPFGQIIKAIRDNEARAISLGYDVARYKLLAFVLSAALSGLAGATKTLVFSFASLTDANWHMSGQIVLMTLLGGMGTVFGPAVGAGIVIFLEDHLSDKVGSLVSVIMGGIFIVCVLLFRRGLVGEAVAWWTRRANKILRKQPDKR